MTPEHVHLVLNHLPFWGPAFALIPILIGLARREKTALMAGLLIAALSGWVTPLVMYTGEQAYERYEKGPVAQYLDPQAEAALEAHEERAESFAVAMYASAAISSLALLALWRAPTWGRRLGVLSAIAAAVAVGSGIWVAESGGKIRRPDFRDPASMPAPAVGEHDDD